MKSQYQLELIWIVHAVSFVVSLWTEQPTIESLILLMATTLCIRGWYEILDDKDNPEEEARRDCLAFACLTIFIVRVRSIAMFSLTYNIVSFFCGVHVRGQVCLSRRRV